jgi:predicted nicotinamide N-methyase
VSSAGDPDEDVLRRIAELGAWLDARLATRDRLISLPLTGEQLTLRGPDRTARERLFTTAQATPDRQLPYWADIWPSGLALGDLLLDRADTLAGTRALELGCGLGITATAALAAGLDLTVADYSPISLAFCRFNALRNTAREPRSLAFNWRDPLPHVLAQIGDPPPFPLIIAADIFYETRDVAPVLALIERLLAPDGQFWLAHPGRETAQRFLKAIRAAGWREKTVRADGPWPGGQRARVAIHLLERPRTLND